MSGPTKLEKETTMRLIAAATILAAMAAGAVADEVPVDGGKKPWRVFILSGQSNMGSKASIEHLEMLLADPATAGRYGHLRKDGNWMVRDDVLLYNRGEKMPLTVGCGQAGRFGPEVGFGVTVGDALEEPVLLIRAAWGGRDLVCDFRPPSSGPGDFPQEFRDALDKRRKVGPGQAVGLHYRMMVASIRDTLTSLDAHFPQYKGEGFEISGFAWLHGWNDHLNAKAIEEYSTNLANLLRDLRKDLDAPDMPMVIGEFGQAGTEENMNPAIKTKHLKFRGKQKAVAEMPEFKGRVVYVPTGHFMVEDGKSFDGGYHYNGRADTVYSIGEAMGKAMLPLLSKAPADRSARHKAACEEAMKRYGEVRMY